MLLRSDEEEPLRASLRSPARSASFWGGAAAPAASPRTSLQSARSDSLKTSGGEGGEILPLLRGAVREERARAAGACGRVCPASVSPRTRTCLALGSAFFMVFVIIMVVVGYKVLAPAYVQSRIQATTLTVTQLRILPAPPALASGAGAAAGLFSLAFDGTLSGLSPVGGTLNAFAASLAYNGEVVGTFTMPAISAAANAANPIAIVATVQALEPAFTRFSTAVLLLPRVAVTLSGTVSVTTVVAGSPLTVGGVDFSKTLTLTGCSGLQGGVVTSFSLTNSTPTAAIADIAVTLPNPSVVGIEPLGDLGADVYFRGVRLGSVTTRNAALLPGPSALTTLRFSGTLQPLQGGDMEVLNALISAYLSNGTSVLSATPRPCFANESCSNALPLFAPLLASGALELVATLPPSPVPLLTGVAVRAMNLEPQGARSVGLALDALVEVDALLGGNSPITLTSFSINCTLKGTTSRSSSEPLGLLAVPLTHISAPAVFQGGSASASASGRGTLGVNLSLSATLDITESDAAFSTFVTYFMTAPAVQLGLVQSALGRSGVTVGLSSVLGNLTVTVPISVFTTVSGIQGFPNVEVQGFNVLDAVDSPPGTVGIAIDVRLFNPSPATFPLGANATLQVVYQGAPLGIVAIYNATLSPGNNSLHAVGYLAPPPAALPAASALMSDYLAGRSVTANVTGLDVVLGPSLITPSWLRQAVRSLTLAATLPGLSSSISSNLLANVTLPALNLDLYDAAARDFYPQPLATGKVCALLQLPFRLPVSDISAVNVSVGFSYEGSAGVVANITASYQVSNWDPCVTQEACAPLLAACSGASLAAAAARMAAEEAPLPPLLRALASPPLLLSPAGVLGLQLYQTPLDTGADVRGVGLSGMVSRILREEFVTVRLQGSASPSIVGLPFGSIALTGIPLDTRVLLAGMANLTHPPASVTNGQIFDTFGGGLNVTVDLNVTNPSSLTGSLGPTTFGIAYGTDSPQWDYKGGLPAIQVSLDNLLVARGEQRFTVPATFFLPPAATSPYASASVRALLGRFLSQLSTNVTLSGLGPSNNNAGAVSSRNGILQPALETLRAGCAFPGIPSPLLTNATLVPDLASLFIPPLKATASLRLTNVLNITLVIEQANLTLFLCGTEQKTDGGVICARDNYTDALGFFYKGDLMADWGGVVAPPLSSRNSPEYPVSFLASQEDVLQALVEAADNKDIVTKANGTVLVSLVGPSGTGILVNVALEQLDLPVCLFDSKDCDVRRPGR